MCIRLIATRLAGALPGAYSFEEGALQVHVSMPPVAEHPRRSYGEAFGS